MSGLTTNIQITQGRTVIQVQCADNGVAYIRQIKPANTACTVEILRIVYNQIRVHCQFHHTTGRFCKYRALVRCSGRVPVPVIIPFGGRNPNFPVITAELIPEISREAVTAVSTGHVLTVQKGKTVLNGISTVCVTAALQGIQIIIITGSAAGCHPFGKRKDIFILRILVINPLAPVTHLLLVKYLQDIFKAHITTQGFCHFTQFVRTRSYQFP